MTHDYEVARKVWEAHVPIEIVLEGSGEEMKPFYMMIPRCSYFGLHIIQYFANYDDCESLEPTSIILDCKGKPLKSFYPVGVLFDMHKSSDADIFSLILRNKKSEESGIIQRETLEKMFMQSVKEADYLKRKAEVITSMKEEEHNQLWSGVANYKFDEFWSVNRRLMESNDGKPFLHCPIRFYESGNPFKQVPLKPLMDSGESVILKDALSTVMPDTDLSARQIVSHGINLPLDTPIAYLSANLTYPDNFVHIVII